MFGVGVVYLGLITAFFSAVSLVKPLSFLGIRTRRRGVFFLALGLVFVVIGWALPAKEVRVAAPRTQLDQFAPVYQFNEFHAIRMRVPREQAYRAIKSVTADEILLFRTLTWIRRFGRPGSESILNAPERQPLLDVATKTSFLVLAEEPNQEIVVGTIVVAPRGWRPSTRPTPEDFKALRGPGFALAAMNFFIEDAGPGLMSRWVMPLACAASRASASWIAKSSTSSMGRGTASWEGKFETRNWKFASTASFEFRFSSFVFFRRSRSVRPSSNSIAINGWPSCSSIS